MLVQFGNNWIQKIPRTAKLGIFLIQLFPNWTACSSITYTNHKYNLSNINLSFHGNKPLFAIITIIITDCRC